MSAFIVFMSFALVVAVVAKAWVATAGDGVEQYNRMKESLPYVLPFASSVIAFHFGRNSGEKRAESAEIESAAAKQNAATVREMATKALSEAQEALPQQTMLGGPAVSAQIVANASTVIKEALGRLSL